MPTQFPPPGFVQIVRAPILWEPNDQDFIVGYVIEVRRDMVGIMLSQPFTSSHEISTLVQRAQIADILHIETKREEIEGLAAYHMDKDADGNPLIERNAEGKPLTDDKGNTKRIVMVNEIAVQWDAETESYAIGMKWENAVSLAAVTAQLAAKRTEIMAAQNAAAAPPQAVVNAAAPAPAATVAPTMPSPAPATPPTNSSTPTPEVAPAAKLGVENQP